MKFDVKPNGKSRDFDCVKRNGKEKGESKMRRKKQNRMLAAGIAAVNAMLIPINTHAQIPADHGRRCFEGGL